jgi:acetyl esterase/lipase
MLRNGFLRSPIYWREVSRGDLNGTYIVYDASRRPDVVVYYCHGGGFSMGSAHFYLEFLLAWVSLLKDEGGYENPALFALDYTLVPEATYPTQLQQTLAGYKYVLSIVDNASDICVSGDSAGATLILSLLLCLSDYTTLRNRMPGLAVIISPWATIISSKNKNTPSDYLNAESLHLYGSQYIGTKASANDSLVSPGRCKDLSWWRRASPTEGWFFVYGSEEVFAPETKDLIAVLRKADTNVIEHEEKNWIHAWPVVKLFLCSDQKERLSGLRSIVKTMRQKIKP